MGEQKGFERLIDSFLHIKDKNIKLVILGECTSRNKFLDRFDKLGLQKKIICVGLQTNPLIFLKSTDVFALSSFSEGFPNSMLEAGICGIPTVAFDVKGGIRDIMIDGVNGFIVPDGELKLYAEALLKALNYPFDKKIIKKHIQSNFDINIIIKDYESLIINVYNEKNNKK